MESTRTETGVTCPNLIITISPSSEEERGKRKKEERQIGKRRERDREGERNREEGEKKKREKGERGMRGERGKRDERERRERKENESVKQYKRNLIAKVKVEERSEGRQCVKVNRFCRSEDIVMCSSWFLRLSNLSL